MSMSREDREIQKMLERDTPSNTVSSFIITILFGIAAALAAMTLNVVIKHGCEAIINANLDSLKAAQSGGFKNMSAIAASVIMLGAWMVSFMIVWHKVEKAREIKKRIKVGLVSIAAALAVYFMLGLVYMHVVTPNMYGEKIFPKPTVLINGVQEVLEDSEE